MLLKLNAHYQFHFSISPINMKIINVSSLFQLVFFLWFDSYYLASLLLYFLGVDEIVIIFSQKFWE